MQIIRPMLFVFPNEDTEGWGDYQCTIVFGKQAKRDVVVLLAAPTRSGTDCEGNKLLAMIRQNFYDKVRMVRFLYKIC